MLRVMGRIIIICLLILVASCKPSLNREDLIGNWQGKLLYSESGDTLVFQDDRKPFLELSDSTFHFQNRWGKKFQGNYDLDGNYILFEPNDSVSVANEIMSLIPDSILVLRMNNDTTLLDVTFTKIVENK